MGREGAECLGLSGGINSAPSAWNFKMRSLSRSSSFTFDVPIKQGAVPTVAVLRFVEGLQIFFDRRRAER